MTHPTAWVSEQVNRKCPPRNMILQLSTSFTDSSCLPPSLEIVLLHYIWLSWSCDHFVHVAAGIGVCYNKLLINAPYAVQSEMGECYNQLLINAPYAVQSAERLVDSWRKVMELFERMESVLFLQQYDVILYTCNSVIIFCARQHICYSAYMLSPVHLSVCLSHGWISRKRLKIGSCNFHHRVAPWL